jgi:hypothetical protein
MIYSLKQREQLQFIVSQVNHKANKRKNSGTHGVKEVKRVPVKWPEPFLAGVSVMTGLSLGKQPPFRKTAVSIAR